MTKSSGAPRWLVWAMIVLASVIALGAGVNAWMRTQFLDTDNWVSTSDELLADDDIRGALSVFLVNELYQNVNIAAELESQLPESLKGLAGPIAVALRTPATEGVDRLLGSSVAQRAWSSANRAAHQTMVDILHDDLPQGLSTANGTVTVDLGELVRTIGTQLGLSTSVLDRLPADAGRFVVFQSADLADAQAYVQAIEWISAALLLIVVALYAGAILLAAGRRRETVRAVGIALALTGLILLAFRQVAVGIAVQQLAEASDLREAVGAIARISTTMIGQLAWGGIIIGLLITCYAIVIGPSRIAVGTRRELAPILANAVAIWITALVALLIVVSLSPGVAIRSWLTGVLLVLLFVLGVELLRRQVRREYPDASFGDQWSRWRTGAIELWNRA